MYYVSINKAIKFELSISPNYKWLSDGSCYNSKDVFWRLKSILNLYNYDLFN